MGGVQNGCFPKNPTHHPNKAPMPNNRRATGGTARGASAVSAPRPRPHANGVGGERWWGDRQHAVRQLLGEGNHSSLVGAGLGSTPPTHHSTGRGRMEKEVQGKPRSPPKCKQTWLGWGLDASKTYAEGPMISRPLLAGNFVSPVISLVRCLSSLSLSSGFWKTPPQVPWVHPKAGGGRT